jgi:hypothetical protein
MRRHDVCCRSRDGVESQLIPCCKAAYEMRVIYGDRIDRILIHLSLLRPAESDRLICCNRYAVAGLGFSLSF